jgi:hypothetical protein
MFVVPEFRGSGVPGFFKIRVPGFRFRGSRSASRRFENVGTRILRTPELRNPGTPEPGMTAI